MLAPPTDLVSSRLWLSSTPLDFSLPLTIAHWPVGRSRSDGRADLALSRLAWPCYAGQSRTVAFGDAGDHPVVKATHSRVLSAKLESVVIVLRCAT